jgi:tetratricopeptide (TPR) repeat protein
MLRLMVALAAAGLSVPAGALSTGAWEAAETEHFIIYSKSPPQRVEKLATDVESYDKLMRMATGMADDKGVVKVHIYEVDGTKDIERALNIDNSGIAGFYDSNIFGPYLVTPRSIDVETDMDFTPALVLHHEYAHHFMLQYFPGVYPDWYVEGFAELIGSSKWLDDGRIGYGMPATHRGHDIATQWVPLQDLLVKEKITYVDTYGEGWALTHFFTFTPARTKQFRAYLDALTSGKSMKEAAQVFGDLDDLNREARRYITAGSFSYRPVKVEIAQPVIQRTRPLSAAEAALIPEVIAFRDEPLESYRKPGERERQLKQREANLNRIREKVQAYPADPVALYILTEAENASGNYAQAKTAVDRLLAIRPNDVRAMARKSMLLSQQASTLAGPGGAAMASEARSLAVKANRADPNEPLPLLAYYESYRQAGEKVPAQAVDGVMQVVSMLPRDDRIRMRLVDQLEVDGRYSEAIAWIMAVANSPHESPLRTTAREKLERLRQELAEGKPRSAR